MSFFSSHKKETPAESSVTVVDTPVADDIVDSSADDASTADVESAEPRRKSPGLGSLFMGDRVIWVIYVFLCIVSLVEVYSAASTLSYKTGKFWMPLVKQAMFLSVGTLIVIVVHRIPFRFFKVIPRFFLIVSWGLLLFTLAKGGATNDAARWIDLGLFSFQPSEVAKGVLIVTVALVLARSQTEEGADKSAFWFILIVTFITCGLIFPENFSTSALLFGVVTLMMIIGRVSMKLILKLYGVLALFVVLFVTFVVMIGPQKGFFHRAQTWRERVEEHFSPEKQKEKEDPMAYDIDKGAQVAHANIAIASSNYVGKLPGNSVQRDFLSQAFSDFIFAVIIEEMGLEGAFFIIFFYIVLLFRAGRIASRCVYSFPAFLIMGLALMFVCQAMLNMFVAVGLFPVTGQTLPLISRGGTSTIINCFYIGMMLSVSRYASRSEKPVHTEFDGSMADIIQSEDRGKGKRKQRK